MILPRIFLLTFFCSPVVQAQSPLVVPRDGFEFDAQLTGQGEKMNYGPFLSYSLIVADREPGKTKKDAGILLPGLRTSKNPPIILKSLNIYLGGKYAASFDTEMCAFAAAWKGGFLNIRSTNLNGYKGGDLAYLRLPAIFQNQQLPGWSLDGTLIDPRPNGFGALPKEISHYRGLYLNGWKTILNYTVGKSNVLEMPMMIAKENQEVFCRIIHIDKGGQERTLFLCDLPEAVGKVQDHVAELTRQNIAIRATFCDLPDPAKLEIVDQNRVVLRIPKHEKPITFRVFIANNVPEKALKEIGQAMGKPDDLPALCRGGPSRWNEAITSKGQRGKDDWAYAVDTIPLPEKNPWNSWIRPGAIDFFMDGRAVLCTWNGDVWIASGIDDNLEKVTWKRYATGIFEALGVRIINDSIYVLGRDQITRLHDLNNDNEADFYENFNNDGPTAPSFHSFAMDLCTDQEGNFYYSRGAHRVKEGTPMHGGIIKVSKDGSKAELLGIGLREANGISVGADGTITAADNQGNWVPASKIDFIKKDGFYGYVWGSKKYPEMEKPLCWIPMSEDNSSGSQVWVPDDRFGPFKGHLFHTSYGSSKLFKVFLQRDNDRFQGGTVSFPWKFDSGIMRARFNPKDGQLYVCGLKGWGTNAMKDGCFQRIRFTGKTVTMPSDLRVEKNRIQITFPCQLDAKSIDKGKVLIEQWNYRWTQAYGSKDYSVKNPEKEGRDLVTIEKVELSQDGKSLELSIPHLHPVHQMGITLKGLKTIDGLPIEWTIYNTINYVP